MRRLLLAAALLAGCQASSQPASPPQSRPTLYILTALPLFWGEQSLPQLLQQDAPASGRAPVLRALDAQWDVRPLDVARPSALQGVTALVVAQPPALAPDELVALDAWVRQGGQAVLFVDPDLQWPSSYAPGDPRRPPQTNLIGPLLAHWGLDLVANPAASAPHRLAWSGADLELRGSGQWQLKGDACQRPLPELAECRLGQGHVWLLADADVLDSESLAAAQTGPVRLIATILADKINKNQRRTSEVPVEEGRRKTADSP
ncbi:MAG: Gldg family protein [Chakrabartia sp.]